MSCSSEAAEFLKPKSAWEEKAACIGMKESYGVLRLMTYKFTLYVLFVCIYIYLPRIFAFQLYLIFKVHQRRDVRPAVYNIVQIVLFFSHPLCVRKLCDEGQNALHITILKLLFPMILIIILYELRFVISDLKIGTS